jgi:molybdopterin-binding protein
VKLSARNQFPGTVVEVQKGSVNGIVKIEIAPRVVITSDITNASIDELGLEVGADAIAVIKASSVMVGID